MTRLKELYLKKVIPEMKKQFGYKNDLAVPRPDKIVVNVGIGEASSNTKLLDEIIRNLTMITGQRPVQTKAKKAISSFKIKKGQKVGLKVTLRGDRMYDFLDKLINVALPGTRDFRGVPKSFDGRGNLSIGFKEHIVFPEAGEEVEITHGLEVAICTTAKKDNQSKRLLELLGIPFKQD